MARGNYKNMPGTVLISLAVGYCAEAFVEKQNVVHLFETAMDQPPYYKSSLCGNVGRITSRLIRSDLLYEVCRSCAIESARRQKKPQN
jgi:hypothetical protein